ncbi:RNA polymerase I-specific transcription initiation factor RRN3 [Scheffersomyces coipomensis]|uniref:RNA polymerase I-specific transcription initiation factor RRN3 n=1 Tax=Scheffersomyces coipomensis TaxID=1788519 RepID=UPI00315CAAEC
MSLQEPPLDRKRSIPSSSSQSERIPTKRMKSESSITDDQSTNKDAFSEKMYQTFVKSAFDALDKINTLTERINIPISHREALPLKHFNIVLHNSISSISKLDNKSSQHLISAILNYKWLEINQIDDPFAYSTFTELYSHFLSVLVSSLPKYLHDVINKLINEFNNFDPFKNEKQSIIINHHQILAKIIRYIPTCINSFPSGLQKHFPHHLSSSTKELTNYINNLMALIDYCPELQYSAWRLIIECCIKLDVELQNELDDLDDDEIEELLNEDIEEDIEEGDSVADVTINQVNNEEDEDNEQDMEYIVDPMNSTTNIKLLSSKLDSIINILLTKTSNSFTVEKLDNGSGITLFNSITSLFRSHILPTHFTKSTQFILFHITQYQPELADSYLVMLIDVAFNPNEVLEKRLKSMQYISSYIARAKNLSRHQVVFIVSYLIGWLNKYIIERENEIADSQDRMNLSSLMEFNTSRQVGGMERFKLFYAAFQALIYIFCFRHKLLYKSFETNESSTSTSTTTNAIPTSNTGDSEWECDLDKFFQRVILSKFNPLKFCDETVAYIFAKIATKLNVCYCYSIIEHNKRERMLQAVSSSNNESKTQSMLPSAVGNFRQKQEFLDLEAYFPFDPLVLPLSKAIVSKWYVDWSAVNPSNGEDDDEDSGSASSHHEDEGLEDDSEEDDDDEDDDEDVSSSSDSEDEEA